MRTVHGAAKGRLLGVGAGVGDRDVGERGAGPLDGMAIDAPALHAALGHAVADAGSDNSMITLAGPASSAKPIRL